MNDDVNTTEEDPYMGDAQIGIERAEDGETPDEAGRNENSE